MNPTEYCKVQHACRIRQMKLARLFLTVALVTSSLALTAAPAPTGQIIFSSNRSGAWRLWSINPDGSGLQQLTRQDGDDQDVDPMFSPDAKSILFTSTRGGKVGVWRMAADGSKPERLCNGDQAE